MNISKRKLLTDLPEYITYSFQDYLLQDDYQQMLNTSKKYFSHIRRKTIIFHLTEKYSIKYCHDKHFRYELIEKVENPVNQIILKLIYFRIKYYRDLFDVFPVHLICKGFPLTDPFISLRNIREFTISQYDLDINTLLDISQCEKATFEFCPGITDISPLKDCEDISLNNCENITDFSSLGRQRRLVIQGNAHLTSVVNFHSIRTLVLNDCCNLVDVSPLHGVYDLSLIECVEVTDISSLGGHHRLEISSCSPVLSGYIALKDIPIVKIAYSNISDISVLRHAKIVYLEECNSIVDVSSLRGVRELTLRSCLQIEDISMLRTVQKLSLYDLPHLRKYEGINEMTDLSLQVSNVKDGMLERFLNVKRLESSFFTLLHDNVLSLLPSLSNLHSLTLCYASPVKLESCLDVHTVILETCTVRSISGLGKNRVVRLFQCEGDEVDVSSLATVPLVSIIKCQFRKVNYESLKNVPRLKIDD